MEWRDYPLAGHWPPLQRLFQTAALSPQAWAICALAGGTLLAVVELDKWLRRRIGRRL